MPKTMRTSWTNATTAPTENLNWNRNATYNMTIPSASKRPSPPCSLSSSPTAEPTNSERNSSTSKPAACRAENTSSPAFGALSWASRITTSVGAPKAWTTASGNPEFTKVSRTDSSAGASANSSSTSEPPVKSRPKLRPFIASKAIDAMTATIERMPAICRPAIKSSEGVAIRIFIKPTWEGDDVRRGLQRITV